VVDLGREDDGGSIRSGGGGTKIHGREAAAKTLDQASLAGSS
jgi:hypothetical protein